MEHLERFLRPEAVETETASERGYRAIIAETGNRRVTRLRIVYPDGRLCILSYAYLQEILYTNHQNLSLVYTSSVITLEGRNLWGLLDHLQSDRAKIIQCYSPSRYGEEPGEGEPVVLSIKRQSLREFAAGGIAGQGRLEQRDQTRARA